MQVKNGLLALAVVASAVGVSCNQAGSNKDNPDSTSVSQTETKRTTRTVEVPEATRTSFEAKYPQASNVTWDYYEPVITTPISWEWTEWPTVDSNDMVAKFSVNDAYYWVWYDETGNWIGTVSEVTDYSSLPAAVNNTIKTQFPGFTIKSVDKENDKNRTAYEIQMENGEDKMKALIAEDGTVIKKKGKVDGEKVKEKSKPED
ncbi:MAG TPA: PepSY-like domain-containing protein [Chitinophagaceae bacterium]|nr:PepSY-like domain-containing protein [Chitinophagaceae bacterium]